MQRNPVWQSDEFEITATGAGMENRVWTRSTLSVSKSIAEQAVERLGYEKAVVINTFGGDRSQPIITVTAEGTTEHPEC